MDPAAEGYEWRYLPSFKSTLFVILLEVSLLNRIDLILVTIPTFYVFNMPAATGKAWYRLQKNASKLAQMEHHYTFLKACCEENLIPHGLNFKSDVGLRCLVPLDVGEI